MSSPWPFYGNMLFYGYMLLYHMAEAGSQWYLGQRWALFARDTWDDCQSWVAACVKHAMLKSITCFKGVYVKYADKVWLEYVLCMRSQHHFPRKHSRKLLQLGLDATKLTTTLPPLHCVWSLQLKVRTSIAWLCAEYSSHFVSVASPIFSSRCFGDWLIDWQHQWAQPLKVERKQLYVYASAQSQCL